MDRSRRQERDRRSGQERRQERDRSGGQERRQEQDRSSSEERRALDRVRDQAKISQLANQWRTMEKDHPDWSHAFERHVDITDQKLAERASKFSTRKEDAPDHATKWRSADAMVVAADGLAHSDEYQRRLADAQVNGTKRFTVTRPLSEVLGPGWRADVYGHTVASGGVQASQWHDGSVAKCTWQRASDGRWHPLTCFPQPSE